MDLEGNEAFSVLKCTLENHAIVQNSTLTEKLLSLSRMQRQGWCLKDENESGRPTRKREWSDQGKQAVTDDNGITYSPNCLRFLQSVALSMPNTSAAS